MLERNATIAAAFLCLLQPWFLSASAESPSSAVWVCMADDDQIWTIDSVRFEDQVQGVINVTMGGYPWRIGFSPDGRYALVLCRDTNNIVLFDARERIELGSIEGLSRPFDVEFSPDGTKAYVTNSGGSSVSIVDSAAWTVSRAIDLGSAPSGISVSQDGSHAYVCLPEEGKIAVVDLGGAGVGRIEVDAGPWDVDIAPDGEKGLRELRGRRYGVRR